MVREPLMGLVIATAGDFGKGKTEADLRRWITANGGKHVGTVDHEVTHLVVTEREFKSRSSVVERAQRLGGVFVVSYDWLEDSLLKSSALKETKYIMANLTAKKARAQAKQATRRKAVVRLAESNGADVESEDQSRPPEPVQTLATKTKSAATAKKARSPKATGQPAKATKLTFERAVSNAPSALTIEPTLSTSKSTHKTAASTPASKPATGATPFKVPQKPSRGGRKTVASTGLTTSKAVLDIFAAYQRELQENANGNKPAREAPAIYAHTGFVEAARPASQRHASTDTASEEIQRGRDRNVVREIGMPDTSRASPDMEVASNIWRDRRGMRTHSLLHRKKFKERKPGSSKSIGDLLFSKPTSYTFPQAPCKKPPNDWQPVDPKDYHIYTHRLFFAAGARRDCDPAIAAAAADAATSTTKAQATSGAEPSSWAAQHSSSAPIETSSSAAINASSPAPDAGNEDAMDLDGANEDTLLSSPPKNLPHVRQPGRAETHIETKQFEYDITLARIDMRHNTNERFNVRLYESHKPPLTYACFLRFAGPKSDVVVKELAPAGSTFAVAMEAFYGVFHKYTRRRWADPESATKPGVDVEINADGIEEGDVKGLPKIADVLERPFVYVKPKHAFGVDAVMMRFGLGGTVFE